MKKRILSIILALSLISSVSAVPGDQDWNAQLEINKAKIQELLSKRFYGSWVPIYGTVIGWILSGVDDMEVVENYLNDEADIESKLRRSIAIIDHLDSRGTNNLTRNDAAVAKVKDLERALSNQTYTMLKTAGVTAGLVSAAGISTYYYLQNKK